MKLILYIVFILSCSSLFAQGWRDSLDLARDAYKHEDYSKALEYYESAQKGAPDNVDLSDEMAQSAYKAREFEKAEKIYQQNNGKSSKTAKADNYHNLGNARMKQENYQGAIDAYKEALRLNPNDDQTRYNLSEAIRKLKDQQKKDNQNNKEKNQDNQNNGDKQDNGDKNPNGDNEDGQNQPKENKQNGNNESDGKSEDDQEGKLKNKTVERMLDKLMKDEAETKRKMAGTKGQNSSPKSGKDW